LVAEPDPAFGVSATVVLEPDPDPALIVGVVGGVTGFVGLVAIVGLVGLIGASTGGVVGGCTGGVVGGCTGAVTVGCSTGGLLGSLGGGCVVGVGVDGGRGSELPPRATRAITTTAIAANAPPAANSGHFDFGLAGLGGGRRSDSPALAPIVLIGWFGIVPFAWATAIGKSDDEDGMVTAIAADDPDDEP
jgi:hypothetical protein